MKGIITILILKLFTMDSMLLAEELPGIEERPFDEWKDEIAKWSNSSEKPDFAINTARVTVKSNVSSSLLLYWQNDMCIGCNLLFQSSISSYTTLSSIYQSSCDNRFLVNLNNSTNICRDTLHLEEKGDYWLIVYQPYSNNFSVISCVIVLANDPPLVFLPIVYSALIFILLIVIWLLIVYLKRKNIFNRLEPYFTSSSKNMEMTEQKKEKEEETNKKKAAMKKRLKSLDTFRGLALCIMIFVNYGGGRYYVFGHAYWDGLLVADLVFAWFVFIMGASVEFAMQGMKKRNTSKFQMVLTITRRTVLLFCIGLFMGARSVDPAMLRIPGVLQRLGITYWGVAFTHIFFVRSSTESHHKWKILSALRDIVDYWLEWIIMFAILTFYLVITYAMPVPDCPTGYVGPGGLANGGTTYECTGGAAGYIDRLILTNNHLYPGYGSYKEIYQTTVNHDPEGILGTFSSIFHCFLGLQIGKIIVTYKEPKARIIRWIVWGVVTTAIALILCKGDMQGGWVPINKNLWSISYVLLLSGAGYFIITILYIVIDMFDWWNGAPFIYPGMNSIVVYVAHSVFSTYFPISWIVQDPTRHWELLFSNLWGTSLLVLFAYVLYQKNIFVAL